MAQALVSRIWWGPAGEAGEDPSGGAFSSTQNLQAVGCDIRGLGLPGVRCKRSALPELGDFLSFLVF